MTTPVTYESLLAEVEASVADVLADVGGAICPDDVFHDVLLGSLHGVPVALASEVWRTQIGGPLPLQLLRTASRRPRRPQGASR